MVKNNGTVMVATMIYFLTTSLERFPHLKDKILCWFLCEWFMCVYNTQDSYLNLFTLMSYKVLVMLDYL